MDERRNNITYGTRKHGTWDSVMPKSHSKPENEGREKERENVNDAPKGNSNNEKHRLKNKDCYPGGSKKGKRKETPFSSLSLSPYPENMHQSHQFSRVQSLLSFSLHIATTTTWLVGMWRGGLTSSTCILEWRERGKSPLKGGTKHHSLSWHAADCLTKYSKLQQRR